MEFLSADGIRDCCEEGVSPNDLHRRKPLIEKLTGG